MKIHRIVDYPRQEPLTEDKIQPLHLWRIRSGGARDTPEPGSIFFSFPCSFGEKLVKIIVGTPPLGNPGSATVHYPPNAMNKVLDQNRVVSTFSER